MILRPDYTWKADFDHLAPRYQKLVAKWSADPERKPLYIWSPERLVGCSYLAEVAVREVRKNLPRNTVIPLYQNWKHLILRYTAHELVTKAQEYSHTMSYLRRNRDDGGGHSAVKENIEYEFEQMWDQCDLLWIDDFHINGYLYDTFDRDVRPMLEQRVKAGHLVVMTGSRPPDKFGQMSYLLKKMFLTVPMSDAER